MKQVITSLDDNSELKLKVEGINYDSLQRWLQGQETNVNRLLDFKENRTGEQIPEDLAASARQLLRGFQSFFAIFEVNELETVTIRRTFDVFKPAASTPDPDGLSGMELDDPLDDETAREEILAKIREIARGVAFQSRANFIAEYDRVRKIDDQDLRWDESRRMARLCWESHRPNPKDVELLAGKLFQPVSEFYLTDREIDVLSCEPVVYFTGALGHSNLDEKGSVKLWLDAADLVSQPKRESGPLLSIVFSKRSILERFKESRRAA